LLALIGGLGKAEPVFPGNLRTALLYNTPLFLFSTKQKQEAEDGFAGKIEKHLLKLVVFYEFHR